VDEINTRQLHPFGQSSKHKTKSHHERNDFNEHQQNDGVKLLRGMDGEIVVKVSA
jgi:hypothetical protein